MIKTIQTKIENWHLKKLLKIKNREIEELEKKLSDANQKLCSMKNDLISINVMLEEKNERGAKKDKRSNNK